MFRRCARVPCQRSTSGKTGFPMREAQHKVWLNHLSGILTVEGFSQRQRFTVCGLSVNKRTINESIEAIPEGSICNGILVSFCDKK